MSDRAEQAGRARSEGAAAGRAPTGHVLTVAAAEAAVVGVLRATVASLPMTYALVSEDASSSGGADRGGAATGATRVPADASALAEDGPLDTSSAMADVLAVSGGEDWPVRASEAAARAGRAVVVLDPGVVDADEVERLTAAVERGDHVPVVLSEPFAGNPALAVHADRIRAALRRCRTVTVALRSPTGGAPGSVLVAARLLRALGGDGIRLDVADGPGVDLAAAGTVLLGGRDADLALWCASSPRTSVSVRAVHPEGAIDVEAGGAATARATFVTLVDADGALELETIYETAHRATLRGVAAGIDAAASARALRAFSTDVRAVLASDVLARGR